MLFFASAAIAQINPSSEQPGRERERFTQLPVPQAQPGLSAVSLPSTAPQQPISDTVCEKEDNAWQLF